MSRHAVRRLIVIAGVIGSLALGAATIRAAAEWTSASAPLSAAPASMQALAAQLAAEAARSSDLQRQLDTVRASSHDLSAALDAATARLTTDTKVADDLRLRLARARTRWSTLEASLGRSRNAAPITRGSSGSGSAALGAGDAGSEGESDG